MSIIFAILLFSFLIFIHELGHFVAAKLSGVQVNEFSLFMGPALFKKTVGETTYALRCIPIGGYCAMEGEDGDSDNPRAFGKAKWWKRLIILLAGAAMNFLAGIVIFFIIAVPQEQLIAPVIEYAEEGSSIVCPEGFHVGDRILKVDNENVYQSSDFSMLLALKPAETHDFLVERNGQKVWIQDLKMQMHEFPNGDGTTSLRYGISFSLIPGNLGNKLAYAWNESLNAARTVRLSLQMLLSGQAGLKDVGGPVQIVQIMSTTAAQSDSAYTAFLNLMSLGGLIAINLAVMNLLPIPALDGGRALGLLLVTGIEAVTRKKINPRVEGYIHGVGMVLLLILMAVIMLKDVIFLFI